MPEVTARHELKRAKRIRKCEVGRAKLLATGSEIVAQVVAMVFAKVVATVLAKVVATVLAEVVARVSAKVVATVLAEVAARVSAKVVAAVLADVVARVFPSPPSVRPFVSRFPLPFLSISSLFLA